MGSGKKSGVIYILTNPSFEDYIKIGYATDMDKRLAQLNRSECIPYAFRVYATYETPTALSDKQLHSIIDRLNPDLRAIETFDGKTRTKEFFAMSPEDAYALLENIAELSGTLDRLKRVQPEEHELQDEQKAAEIQAESKERRSPFSFVKCQIPIGAELVFVNRPEITATVAGDREILYCGETHSLSSVAKSILESRYMPQGPLYWTYQGRVLSDIRRELEEQGLYR